jgi:ferric-dicitrate binding protein FerR (iron transport regulator)
MNRRFYRSFFTLSAFMLLFVAPGSNLIADDSAGTMTRVQGKVTVRMPGWNNSAAVRAGDSLAVGGVLETAGNSRAQLIFTDGAFIRVLPDTTLRVNQYSYTTEDKRSSAIIQVLGGRARFVVYDKTRSNGSRFVVETEHASIGAGIADFIVSVSPGETEVAVIGSSLSVRNISSLVVGNVGLGTNQKTVVKEKKPPSQPSTLPAEQRRKYIRDADF